MVVYRIVSEHRGSLHVDTQPGGGTRFVISLPLTQRPIRLLGHHPAEAPASINEARQP
jgi:chemotaxis protein histidine kinase CheA